MREYLKSFFTMAVMLGSVGVLVTGCGEDEPPTAGFTFEATELAVTFTNTSEGATSQSWDFGDGNTSTEESPTHTYAAAGDYTVVLTATNDDGSDTAEETVSVTGGASANCEDADNTVSPDINYTWATDNGNPDTDAWFDGFGGYTTTRIENPDQSGVNESCYVMELVRAAPCEVWGGAGQQLDGRIDFSTDPGIIKLDVWGEATDVTLVFENLPFPDNEPLIARTVNMTTSNEWETLTFDFSDDASGNTYGNLILYITRNQGDCAGETYYVDNLRQE